MSRKVITQREFDNIRAILDNTTLGPSQIARIVDRSTGAVLNIKKAKTWREYQDQKQERLDKWPRYGTPASEKAKEQKESQKEQKEIDKDWKEQVSINPQTLSRANLSKVNDELFERQVEAFEKIAYALEDLASTAKKKKRVF